MNFDKDLSFLSSKPFGLSLDNKVVFEAHWYTFDFTEQWEQLPPNQACRQQADEFRRDAAFLTTGDNIDNASSPLFISEYGFYLQDTSPVDGRYFNCFQPNVAEMDLDLALWTLQASYHYRQGNAGSGESSSVLEFDWSKPRSKPKGFTILPTRSRTKWVMCDSKDSCGEVTLSSCRNNNSINSRWSQEGDGSPILKLDLKLFLKAVGYGVLLTVSDDCSGARATWKLVSDSMLQIAAMDEQSGNPLLCLDATPSSNSTAILTRSCVCLNNESWL